ncbi:hypothetical protein GCM10023189_55110 [Nibrella saemangeumensis]|uniref:Outer membrane protein beta-barrel domain-containing protein n=1 Tax=Nibrella saemangeumensis TaxID=1084526 RepID=A0ABP8NNT1_9BACT
MKKVAAACLILSLIGTGPIHAQSRTATQPRLYTPTLAVASNRTDFTTAPADEKPIKGRKKRKQAEKERAEYERSKYGKSDRTSSDEDMYPDYSQPTHLIEMSFRVAPVVSFNTVQGQGSTYERFTDNGAGVRLSVGPSLDYFFYKNRYSFSTGLWYTIKRSGYVMPGSFGQPRWDPSAPVQQSVYNLQYVQVPISVKMFANNIAPAMRLYVQCGGIADVKLSEKAQNEATDGLFKYAESSGKRRQYGFADLGMLVGAGIQYKLNNTNALNLGLSYQRGLVDVARGSGLVSKNNLLGLDLAFKF